MGEMLNMLTYVFRAMGAYGRISGETLNMFNISRVWGHVKKFWEATFKISFFVFRLTCLTLTGF